MQITSPIATSILDPTRRTLRAIDGLYEAGDIEKINEITAQEKLSDVVTLDASIGKSLKFGKYYLNLNFSCLKHSR